MKKKKKAVPKYNGSQPLRGMCTCGHIGDCPNSDHKDVPMGIGHGACTVKGCMCEQFTWSHFV